jgi:histidyl-tRNA synthetase
MRGGEAGADCWISGVEDVPLEQIMREAARMRGEGRAVEFALRPQSLSKQKKAAQASGAREFVTLSNDGTNG